MSSYKSFCTHGGSECCCKDTPKLPLVSSPGCSNDLAAVLALPNQWTPRRCGPILTNYLEERKRNHEKIMNDLTEEAMAVNKNIDDKIRDISEILLIDIENNQKDMNCVIEDYALKDIPLHIEYRNDALKEITKLASLRIQDLSNYKTEAQALEKRRAEGLRNLLQSYFQKLIANGHYSPKKLLYKFDERIFGINQQLLSNIRAYTEVETYLRVQLDENIVHLRSSINRLCLPTNVRSRHQSATSWFSWTRENRYGKRSSSVDSWSGRRSIDSVDLDQCVHLDLDEFQRCVFSLVQSYRSAVKHIFDGFSDVLDELHKNVSDSNFNMKDNAFKNMKEMTERAIHRISDGGILLKKIANQECIDVTRSDIITMQTSLLTFGERLRNTYKILHDASLLLNPHLLRSALAQKLTVTAVEDMQTNYDNLELANEISFNIMLEQLRGASDTDKVQNLHESIIIFLDKVAETYNYHKEAEVAKFEEYMNLQQLLANTLLSEYSCFLEDNPKNLTSESRTSSVSYSSNKMTWYSSLREALPRAMMQTNLYDLSLKNWRNGFLEALENNVRFTPDELSRLARKWVDEKIFLVNMRYFIKNMSHSIRVERVQAARDARLAELRLHEARLNIHLEAVYNLVNSLPMEASEFPDKNSPEIYPLYKWVQDVQQKLDSLLQSDPLDPEVKRLKMTSYAARLNRHYQLYAESLDSAIEKFRKNIEIRIQTATISNLQFMSKLKLFNEGGRYAAAEVIKTSFALTKSADAVETCRSRTLDALNSRRNQLLTLADHLLTPLTKSLEEVAKPFGKGQIDKKKPPNKKK